MKMGKKVQASLKTEFLSDRNFGQLTPGKVLKIYRELNGFSQSQWPRLASNLNATHIRIDTIEQGLKDICGMGKVENEGYRLAFSIVRDIFLGSNKQ